MTKITTTNQKGFTLIELLVVIAIIGLLSSVVLASLNGARKKSRDARRVADLKQLQTAMELFYNDNNRYPIAGTGGSAASITTLAAAGLSASYMGAIPDDPLGGSQHYYWETDSTGQNYCMAAKMENTPIPASTCATSAYATALATADGGTAGTTSYSVGP